MLRDVTTLNLIAAMLQYLQGALSGPGSNQMPSYISFFLISALFIGNQYFAVEKARPVCELAMMGKCYKKRGPLQEAA